MHLLNRLFFVVLPFSFCFSASRRLRKNLQEFVLRQRYIVVRQEGSHTPSFRELQRLGLSHFLVVLLLVCELPYEYRYFGIGKVVKLCEVWYVKYGVRSIL